MRNGKISSLPISISIENTILDSTEKDWKFSTGPTLEIPGPTLLSMVSTPDTVVAKSKLSSATSKTEMPNTNTYALKYAYTP